MMIRREWASSFAAVFLLMLQTLLLPTMARSFSPGTAKNQPRHDPERTVVLAYHKPAGLITTHAVDDELGRGNVYQDIYSLQGYVGNDTTSTGTKPRPKSTNDNNNETWALQQVTGIRSKLHAVGRLDADTTGLLLLTNDGGLVHHVTDKTAAFAQELTAPVAKTYQAVIMGYYEQDSDMIQMILTQGVDIGSKYGGLTLPPDDLVVLGHPTQKSTTVSLTIREGKNRQVRRMFHSCGSGVMKLQRTSIGTSLTLEGLQQGEWRVLTDAEVRNGLEFKPRVLVDLISAKKAAARSKPGRRRRRKR